MKVRVAKKAESDLETSDAPTPNRWGHLAAVAESFKDFTPAAKAFTKVTAVPTIWPQFDHATRVGGLPNERFTLVHGPSTGGKTLLCIAMMLSYLKRDLPVYHVDAERTTDKVFLRKFMGEYVDHPLFNGDRPDTYEETVKDVRRFCKITHASKCESGLVVVDSIRKLVPRDQLKLIMKEMKNAASDKEENVRSRAAQIKAQMNAAWLDELVVLLGKTRTAMVTIAREMVDADNQDPRAKKFGTNVKTAGGGALFYDASLDLRCSRWKSYGKEQDGRFVSFGDLHRVDIQKSKVSGKEAYKSQCHFHISNGHFTPEGFDRARDLVDLARRFDIIQGTSWLAYGKTRWQGEDKAVKRLTEDAELFARIEAECREVFMSKPAEEE